MGLRPEKDVQSIAVEDIAVFAALAFANPQDFLGKTIELAGDELTEAQTAEVFSKVIGRPVTLAAPSGGRPCFGRGNGRHVQLLQRRRLRCGYRLRFARSILACSPSSNICAGTAGKISSRFRSLRMRVGDHKNGKPLSRKAMVETP